MLILCACYPSRGISESTKDWLHTAEQAARGGRFGAAIDALNRALEEPPARFDDQQRAKILARRAAASGSLGNTDAAIQDLREALELVPGHDRPRIAALQVALGQAYLSARLVAQANELLEPLRQGSDDLQQPALAAAVQMLQGNIAADTGDFERAFKSYRRALNLAERADSLELSGESSVNALHAALSGGRENEATELAPRALELVSAQPDSHKKAYALLNIGRSLLDSPLLDKQPVLELIYRALSRAFTVAESVGDKRSASYAKGFEAELYENQGRIDEALRLYARATFLAQQIDAPELLYLWYWNSGRLLAERGDPQAAIEAYRLAIFEAQRIRDGLLANFWIQGESFRDKLGPMYLEFADLLLVQAAQTTDTSLAEQHLLETRANIEQFKRAELQDYFLDECVARAGARSTDIDRIAPRTAIIYPILLPDRTELLVTLPGGMRQFTASASAEMLTAEVRQFRSRLEKRSTNQYLIHGQQLYDWLLRPLETALQSEGIETLVIVPDGPLRTIPMAALHDGEQFLVERYAIATTPGLTLTDAAPLQRQNLRVLLNGLTQSVQGFSALPAVDQELANIHALIGERNGTLLQDESFLLQNVESEISGRPYSVVHIASHGRFEPEADDSFLLTYRDKLTMDRLENFMQFRRFGDDPIELLTLSACETAAGDDRAALGLSGIAVKSGARSAVGTLWFISDQASSKLIVEFYRGLRDPNLSKAEALRQAQLTLRADRRFRHPGYWAPFILIGNWL